MYSRFGLEGGDLRIKDKIEEHLLFSNGKGIQRINAPAPLNVLAPSQLRMVPTA
jgi:hypothetical protein